MSEIHISDALIDERFWISRGFMEVEAKMAVMFVKDQKQTIELLRRKLDVAIIALECIADRPDPTKDEMLLVKFAQEALARYKAALSGEGET